ncbi:ABC transporter ATP-binding protein [Arenimonas sp.]|uniref:ABC transporter ATP-binding protein n=1 Tax=Arenimonas sp. TaxID=1872635 RepID=UPI0039E63F01
MTTHPKPRPDAPLATLRGASKSYGKLRALSGMDLEVRAGEVLALLGANGAGKTTTLGLLTGRLAPDEGEVSVFGGDPRDAAIRRGLGVMLQEGGLPENLRVAEHVRLFSTYYPSPRPVAETLELAGLSDLAKRPYSALSGGQQRRVQFALAICGNPALLFVDEPTVGLDVESRRGFWTVLRRLREQGTGIVLTTHYLEEADALADRIVLVAGGRKLAEGTPEQIKSQASGKRIRARSSLDLASISSWPEVRQASLSEGRVEILSDDADALLRRWIAQDPQLSDIDVRTVNLEDAFLSLTGTHGDKQQEKAA